MLWVAKDKSLLERVSNMLDGVYHELRHQSARWILLLGSQLSIIM